MNTLKFIIIYCNLCCNDKISLQIGSWELSKTQQYAVYAGASMVLCWLAGAGAVLFWVLGKAFYYNLNLNLCLRAL